MKKIIFILLLLIPMSFAYDLSDYPKMFREGTDMNVKIVVGDLALASDTIGAVEIASTLQVDQITKELYGGIEPLLASEVVGEVNMIVIGGPCANSIASKLMGYPADCNEGITPNTAIIRYFDLNGTHSILIAGSGALDTRRASRLLSLYYEKALPESDFLEVKQTIENQISVN